MNFYVLIVLIITTKRRSGYVEKLFSTSFEKIFNSIRIQLFETITELHRIQFNDSDIRSQLLEFAIEPKNSQLLDFLLFTISDLLQIFDINFLSVSKMIETFQVLIFQKNYRP
jgi:hypothetical protein